MSETPMRPIRIDNTLWAKAQVKASNHGMTASEVIRTLLREWVER